MKNSIPVGKTTKKATPSSFLNLIIIIFNKFEREKSCKSYIIIKELK
jgi:hypothetical protein